MSDRAAIRERYMRDDLSRRLGGIASNLARVSSFSSRASSKDAVYRLVDESKWFIEWTAAEAREEDAEALVALQLELAWLQRDWERIWANPATRAALATHAKYWSNRVLRMSGLLGDRA